MATKAVRIKQTKQAIENLRLALEEYAAPEEVRYRAGLDAAECAQADAVIQQTRENLAYYEARLAKLQGGK